MGGGMIAEADKVCCDDDHKSLRSDTETIDIKATDYRQPLSMDEIPFPYEDMELFRNKIIYYESSRGCPYSCSYCLSSIDRRVRLRSTELVKKELQLFLEDMVEKAAGEMGSRKQSKLNREFIIEFINLHYAEDLCLEKMAGMTETSPKYFSNFFKKAIGINFIEYLNKIRIQHAKELLKNSDILISDIGSKVGYANSSTFTSTFKKYCGISPAEYRKDFR
jgi:YesN/AraC family two-component response regulator